MSDRKEYQKQYYEANKESIKEKRKQRYQVQKDEIKIYSPEECDPRFYLKDEKRYQTRDEIAISTANKWFPNHDPKRVISTWDIIITASSRSLKELEDHLPSLDIFLEEKFKLMYYRKLYDESEREKFLDICHTAFLQYLEDIKSIPFHHKVKVLGEKISPNDKKELSRYIDFP